MLKSLLITSVTATTLTLNAVENWDAVCDVKKLPNPTNPTIDAQLGAVGTLPNGDVIAAFHRGEVMVFSKGKWKLWGSGLHEPLGMHVENQHSIVVVQRSELTRISDTDKDGKADSYESLCNNWGMSGNYHEFAFGAVKAPDGDFYVALGTASNGAGVREEIRGEWNAGGVSPEKTKENFIKATKRKELPRMYAAVPHRGWVIKVNPTTGKYKPYALGFRTPHGVCVTTKGDLYINDNQGDWLGSSKLYKIEEGKFHGHPASLVWKKGWNKGIPADLKPAYLDSIRTKSVCFLPQADLANSPTQIIELPKKGFGPYGGMLVMGDMNQARLVRYMPDIVKGVEQGSAISFLEHSKLGRGNAKISVGAEGQLYIGKTHLSWAGDSGLVSMKYKDVPHIAIMDVKLTEKGFRVILNESVDQSNISLSGTRYSLNYQKKYGSKKIGLTDLKASSLKVDGKIINIELETPPIADQVYDISLNGVKTPKLGSLFANRFFYTAHQVLTDKKSASLKGKLKKELFVFENAFRGRGVPFKQQAKIINNAGIAGVGSVSEKGALKKIKGYYEAGLKVYSIYVGGSVSDDGYKFQREELSEMLRFLKGSDVVLEVNIRGDNDSRPAQRQAVKMMQEIADLAHKNKLKVVVYPHSGKFVASTLRESVDIVKSANRRNLGVMFNLCHFLKVQPNASLSKELAYAKDFLWGVSTSGAEKNSKSWEDLIKPLDENSYMQTELFSELRKIGYEGYVGLQCYNIKSKPQEYLLKASRSYLDFLKKVNK